MILPGQPISALAAASLTARVDFIATHENEDFLLVVAHDEPHGPSLCPVEYSRMYENFVFPRRSKCERSVGEQACSTKDLGGVSFARRQPDRPIPNPSVRKHFFGSHTFIDSEIGRILDQIEKTAPNALVIYTADHGVFLESHRLSDKGPAMYEEITNIPFIAKWPGHSPPPTSYRSRWFLTLILPPP